MLRDSEPTDLYSWNGNLERSLRHRRPLRSSQCRSCTAEDAGAVQAIAGRHGVRRRETHRAAHTAGKSKSLALETYGSLCHWTLCSWMIQVGTRHRVKGADHALESIHYMQIDQM
ncbi:hypothetical protein B296_00054682 [Ensete ventricosum]|uniref:Uncharacterized protein n=1 Tax=Ensete ventricosum TaxID=4639 RepID=A0A426Y2X0_ENSVE|nr:hypothetical protein B296_00054682 [Ensete ventricosum]